MSVVAEQDGTTSQDIDLTQSNIKPTYSRLRMGVIQITPESMKCKLYCRGVNCKYCTATGWAEAEQAIRGLYSSWITSGLLAMARPTETAISEFGIIQQFKNQNIQTVINLQTAHEHAFCGPPLHTSGFSYDPELFMRHKNTNVGKIAVHCHAGLGRTCTLVACYLVWSTGMTAERAIGIVRIVRPKAIQSPKQIMIIQQFAGLIGKYATVLPSELSLPFSRYLMMQNDFLPGDQSRRYCHIPKVVFLISDLLLHQIFEDGVKYSLSESEKHNVRACTMGKLSVEWKNAFTAKGKARTRYIVNLFARISAFPFERDEELEWKFKHISVVNLESRLMELEPKELIYVLNCFMESPARPYCSRKEMIKAMKKYAPIEQETTSNMDPANLLTVPAENGAMPTNNDVNSIFDVKCGASWQCMIFFLCNVLSYLMGENYDIVVELITVWLLNEMDEDVKSAVHSHMRDLFARNLREQEQQSRLLKAKQNKA